MKDQIADKVAFVNSLPLPSPEEYKDLTIQVTEAKKSESYQSRSQAAPGQDSAQVNDGSLTSFLGDITGQAKSDVMNSTLLAQLSSNVTVDRYTKPIDWFKNYVNILENVGWNLPGWAFKEYKSSGTTVNLDKAVLEIAGAIATGNDLAILTATMGALETLGDDSAPMRIWEAGAESQGNGTFQIMPCSMAGNGNVIMILTGMQFKATHHEGRFLWWSWSSDNIKIQSAVAKAELNNDVYSIVRNDIIKKLGDRATTFVADLPL